ncbi:MAG: hypothetical protein FVQ79_13155 [Planctomycetes bacterium]|nr:hypothetical protein [Planctomycetota bacterium]
MQDITEEEVREERIEKEKKDMTILFDRVKLELDDMELAKGVDKNSWLYAGCIEDLQKARTRILNYIERVLK